MDDDVESSSAAVAPAVLSPETRKAIAAADLVVVMVGTDENNNTEGADRSSIALPSNYQSLIDQVSGVNRPAWPGQRDAYNKGRLAVKCYLESCVQGDT